MYKKKKAILLTDNAPTHLNEKKLTNKEMCEFSIIQLPSKPCF